MNQGPSSVRLTVTLCTAEVAGMVGFATFAALLPGFLDEWALSKTEAGWLSGIFSAGYLVAVPVLVSLTDRMAARRIYLVSMVLTCVSYLGFALLAEGFWTALILRFISGIGLAGTYMPGMKILGDRLSGRAQSRGIAFYASHFSIGWALSFLLAGEMAAWLDWRWTFALCALGPVLAFVLVGLLVPENDARDQLEPDAKLLDFLPVLKCRQAMGYVLAYAVHNFEAFAARSWIVVFLVFAQGQHTENPGWNITLIATIFTIVGMPASVLGNEFAVRAGRRRAVAVIMLTSCAVAAVFGFLAAIPFGLLVAVALFYGALVTGDSASITAGAVAAAPPGHRGATMAVHACIGFAGSFMGPVVFGVVLDGFGGGETTLSWGAAFLTMGLVAALGPLAVAVLSREEATSAPSDGSPGKRT
jgi:predicted MFS family arabinose efflux permease